MNIGPVPAFLVPYTGYACDALKTLGGAVAGCVTSRKRHSSPGGFPRSGSWNCALFCAAPVSGQCGKTLHTQWLP